MELIPTAIDGVLIIRPDVFADSRGFFLESWNRRSFREIGLDLDFCQDNHSRSAKGILRGLHYQLPNPQGKLVRVTQGRIYDVAVDMRRSSETFGNWVGVELSHLNHLFFYLPPGIAHGFLSLDDDSDVMYKCVGYYEPSDEHCLLWNDPSVGIDWPLEGITPLLSSKDMAGKPLTQCATFP